MAKKVRLVPPKDGKAITPRRKKMVVPDHPIIPFIEGDGIGVDIWPAAQRVVNAAVAKAYGGSRRIAWLEVYAGEKANRVYGREIWLPEETLKTIEKYRVAIKGPLGTPVGGGFRSLNVTLRQVLDLYVCLRPVRWFKGLPSPVRHPELVDMVVFRENTEDIYAGIEWEAGTREAKKVVAWLQKEMKVEHSLSQDLQHRHQDGLQRRDQATRPGCHPIRPAAQATERHPRSQGQYHEVHRGRLPPLWL